MCVCTYVCNTEMLGITVMWAYVEILVSVNVTSASVISTYICTHLILHMLNAKYTHNIYFIVFTR